MKGFLRQVKHAFLSLIIVMTVLALQIACKFHVVNTEREIRVELTPWPQNESEMRVEPTPWQQGEIKGRVIPPIQESPEVPCAPDDQESSWAPVIRRNVAKMAIEDGKPGEETRPFLFPVNLFRVCGAGCVEINMEQHRAAHSDIVMCNQLARTIADERYCSPVIFHAFWGTLPVNPHVPLYILSFLITQDLEHSQLWIWSRKGVELEQDPLMAPFVSHSNVHFKQFDGTEIIRSLKTTAIPEKLIEAKDG